MLMYPVNFEVRVTDHLIIGQRANGKRELPPGIVLEFFFHLRKGFGGAWPRRAKRQQTVVFGVQAPAGKGIFRIGLERREPHQFANKQVAGQEFGHGCTLSDCAASDWRCASHSERKMPSM